MKRLLFVFAMLFSVSFLANAIESPEWVYEGGEWLWDGNANTVIDLDNGHVWNYECGSYTYLGRL